MEKLRERYDLQKELIESEITDEETKKMRLKELEKEQRLREKELEKKKKQEEKKAFLLSQAVAVGEVVMSTAMGVAEANAMAPATFGASLGWIPLIIGSGAAQLATILAQTIPAFKDGHLAGTYEGTALINDGGAMEVLQRKDGRLEISNQANKLVNMQKGDLVHKDISSFIATIPTNKLLEGQVINSVQMANMVASNREVFDEHFKASMLDTMRKGFSGTKIINDNKAIANAMKEVLSDNNYTKNFL